jgi:hypothetical protein
MHTAQGDGWCVPHPCSVQLLESCQALPELCQVCCLQRNARMRLVRVARQLRSNTLKAAKWSSMASTQRWHPVGKKSNARTRLIMRPVSGMLQHPGGNQTVRRPRRRLVL